MIEIKDLHKSYQMGSNSLHVLKGIDFSVKEGELVSIMGSSGSGKSTLLQQIGGLDIPNVELVIQLSPPENPEPYIHRSGRTGRAGKNGINITFFD